MKRGRNVLRGVVAIAGVMALAGVAAGVANAATTTTGTTTTCTSGPIPSGSYGDLTITGPCSIPAGANITVRGTLRLSGSSSLDAVSLHTLRVFGNVEVGFRVVLGLGCSADAGPQCNGMTGTDVINGNLRALSKARAMIIHGITLFGNFNMQTGGAGVNCLPLPLPNFSDLEDSTVFGNVSIQGLTSCWLGVIRNRVNGNVLITNNRMADVDANEVVTNTVFGNLSCFNNRPAAQIGDSGGSLNTVTGSKLGECAKL
jgi:hypothetical protein